HGVDGDAEQQQLRGVEALGAWAVEAAEDRQHLGLVLLLQGFDARGGFLLDLLDSRVTLRQFFLLPADDGQQCLRIRRKLIRARHGRACITSASRAQYLTRAEHRRFMWKTRRCSQPAASPGRRWRSPAT